MNQAEIVNWSAIERIIHQDPGGRTLAGFSVDGRHLDAGQLQAAAVDLAQNARRVAIVTGFCRQTDQGVTAETDGPPGALFLAAALGQLGVPVTMISDRYGLPLLTAGAQFLQLTGITLRELPIEQRLTAELPVTDRWCRDLLSDGSPYSHLIAIERAGPSHTLDSVVSGVGGARSSAQEAVRAFELAVPPQSRNRCHNLGGLDIDDWTGKAERLFELAAAQFPAITTIGVGDGANEIGMGAFAWSVLRDVLDTPEASRVVCRIATRFTPIAGVSDWGAYALALGVCAARGQLDRKLASMARQMGDLVELLVAEAGAVDGITGRATPTVDGLSLAQYLEPLEQLIALFGL